MAKRVVVFGAERLAQVLRIYLEGDGGREVSAFTVDRAYVRGQDLEGLPLVPFEDIQDRFPPRDHDMLVAVGYRGLNRLRAQKLEQAKAKGYACPGYVNSRASVWPQARLGENCIVLEHNVVQPGAALGDNVILWCGNHVGRDSVIGDHCYVSTHAAINGEVTIGPYSFVGSGAIIKDGVSVGAENIVGAGTVIMRNTRDGEVFVAEQTPRFRLNSTDFMRMTSI